MDNEVIQPPACEVGGVADGPAYDLTFFLCYAANTAVMVAVSVLFRYADFVRFLGGAEMQLGLIVGVGTIGALLMRLVQGVATDRYGPRRVWLLSLMIFIAAMLLHLGIERVDGIGIYVVRILFMVSVAGAFGASLTYVSLRVPENRMGEMIGMLGSSGFIGLALGPTIGDLLFSGPEVTRVQIQAMFLVAAAMGFVWLVPWIWLYRPPHQHPRITEEELAIVPKPEPAESSTANTPTPSDRDAPPSPAQTATPGLKNHPTQSPPPSPTHTSPPTPQPLHQPSHQAHHSRNETNTATSTRRQRGTLKSHQSLIESWICLCRKFYFYND